MEMSSLSWGTGGGRDTRNKSYLTPGSPVPSSYQLGTISETTFQDVRQYLGIETQRQWSDLAILRPTPALLGLYSLVTVWAHGLMQTPQSAVTPYPAAWFHKSEPTFSVAIAAVCRVLSSPTAFFMSRSDAENAEIPLPLLRRFVETLCLLA